MTRRFLPQAREQSLKCGAHRALMRHTNCLELSQSLEIIQDRLVSWLEVESFHAWNHRQGFC